MRDFALSFYFTALFDKVSLALFKNLLFKVFWSMWVPALWQGEGRKDTSRLEFRKNSRTKNKFITYLYAKVNSLVQANLSVDRVDSSIRLKIRLFTIC